MEFMDKTMSQCFREVKWFHFGNLILGIQCFGLIAMHIHHWRNG